jgi:hypothetical protein
MTKTKTATKTAKKNAKTATKTAPAKSAKTAKTAPAPVVAQTSRKAEVIAALKKGATIDALMNLPGRTAWQRHSVRGFICTLGKSMTIESSLTANGERFYKLA